MFGVMCMCVYLYPWVGYDLVVLDALRLVDDKHPPDKILCPGRHLRERLCRERPVPRQRVLHALIVVVHGERWVTTQTVMKKKKGFGLKLKLRYCFNLS